jgi:hypothetical protein
LREIGIEDRRNVGFLVLFDIILHRRHRQNNSSIMVFGLAEAFAAFFGFFSVFIDGASLYYQALDLEESKKGNQLALHENQEMDREITFPPIFT